MSVSPGVRQAQRTQGPAWRTRLLAQLDAADVRAQALVHVLSRAQLNWNPTADAWSVGQCLEHLAICNEIYVQPIARALNAASPTGPVHEIEIGWFGRWFIRSYIDPATQKRKTKTTRKAVPVSRELDASILDRFLASNVAIREVADAASRYDVNRVRFVNPFVFWIRFTVGTGLEILARHNHRHLGQAQRVTELAGFPG